MPPSPRGVEFERAVMLTNPMSRYAHALRWQEDYFREQLGPKKLHVIQAPDGRLSSAIDTLGEELEEGDVLLNDGGDGLLNIVVNSFVSGKLPDAISQTPILPLWKGGACDGANSLNPRRLRNNPAKILEDGYVITSNPLETRIDMPDGRHYWQDSALYAGAGITALFAHRVGEHRATAQKQGRLKNKIDDRRIALGTLRDAQAFTVEQAIDDKVHRATMVELSAFRGPRMGEVFYPAVALDAPEWRLAHLQDKRPATLGSTLGRLCLALEVGQPVKVKPRQRVRFKVLDTVLMQFDGEPITVPADSEVRIMADEHTVRYVTTYR
jgi:diacylglycerol kinase family enzyme